MKISKLKKVLAVSLASAMTLSMVTVNSTAKAATNEKASAVATATTSGNKDELKRKIVGYFPEWAYKSEVQGYFDVADLQWEQLTDIQYSFAAVGSDNKICFSDKEAAIEEDFSDHELVHNGKKVELDPSLPYKGHFNVLQTMKKQYPDVDVIISVGGWGASRGFYTMLDTDEGINTFADSCVDFIRQYGFDGVDIDFEYPSSTATCGNPADSDVSEPRRATINARYNLMMKTLREKLNKAGEEDGTYYQLSAAVTASSWVLGGVTDNSYANYLDFLSVMSYDFHGGWNQYVENLANIWPDSADTETINMAMPTLCMDWAYNYYRGVLPPEKILMGIPYYTRGWENVQGGNNGLHGSSKTPASAPYNLWGDDDNGDGTPDPAGANPLWYVLNLMEEDSNLKMYFDEVGGVPYVWQSDKKVFLSFENEKSIDNRVSYIKEKNLGGALIWVMNGDYGLNSNYVKGSTNVNEGKYTFGNTLTKRLRDGLDKMGDCTKTDESLKGLSVIDVAVDMDIKYDHPNGELTFTLKNDSNATINKDWELAFDVPKSCIYSGVEGGTGTATENGEFNRITLKSSGWTEFTPGSTATIKAKFKLCFSGVKNITVNGMIPYNIPVDGNYLPTLTGVNDQTITVGSTFNALSGVKATDEEDGDLTKNIQVIGSVNANKVGEYTLTYRVSDSNGAVTSKTATIVVLPKLDEGLTFFDAGTQYTKGSQVVYKDPSTNKYAVYEATQWWTPAGTLPTNSGYWTLVKYLTDDEPVEEYAVEDVNKDGKIDLSDLTAVASAYKAKSSEAAYVAQYDVNSDGVINIVDIVLVAKKM